MALISTEILVPLELLRGEIQENIAQTKLMDYPMLRNVQKATAYQTEIEWPVSVAGADTYGRSTSTTPNSTSNSDANLPATLPIGSRVLEHKFSVDITQAVQAARTAPQALRNLYKQKVNAGTDAMMKKLEQLIYSGDGTAASHGVIGLDKAISNVVAGTPATDIYAGIDGVAYPTWVSFKDTNGTNRALTTALMRKVATGQGKLGGNYNLVMTTFELADTMEALFEGRLAVDQVSGTLDLGFTGITYQGREVKKNVYCPDNSVYLLNTSDVILHTFGLAPAMSTMPGGASEMVNAGGVNMLLTRMPQANPHSVDFLLSTQPQLQVFNRHSVAKLEKVQ